MPQFIIQPAMQVRLRHTLHAHLLATPTQSNAIQYSSATVLYEAYDNVFVFCFCCFRELINWRCIH